MTNKIIGISGISGAGKSTLTKALSKHLNATNLYWDDFDELSESPDDYVTWFERGKNYLEFNYQALADTLCRLKNNSSVIHPSTLENLIATPYIIVDTPLGNVHQIIGVLTAFTAFAEIYVDDLWIEAKFRGKGYGKRLLQELENRFQGKGFNNINLVTSAFQALEHL